ncbi:MAG TPA: hypothetical protein VGE07_19790, partial [Herpetosiphonaceae bacterium]
MALKWVCRDLRPEHARRMHSGWQRVLLNRWLICRQPGKRVYCPLDSPSACAASIEHAMKRIAISFWAFLLAVLVCGLAIYV